jgi:hypothetical protein
MIDSDSANCAAGIRQEVWLLGQPSLNRFLKFVRDNVVGGDALDPRGLADEWRRANDHYHQLEEAEAGIADGVECHPLASELMPLAEEVMADPRFRRTYDTLPTTFAMVELDRLVVFQPHVTRQFVDEMKANLGPRPDLKTLFRRCMPLDRAEPPIKVQRLGSRRYLLSSASADLRFHEAALFDAEQITNYAPYGPIGAVIGLVVGFGSNFLNGIRDEDKRILLHNGYHRAVAMRELGITHAPCIIQTVTRRDELSVAANRSIAEAPFFYFGSKRPPLLKDFFDPMIRKVLRVKRIRRVIELQFEVREFETAE